MKECSERHENHEKEYGNSPGAAEPFDHSGLLDGLCSLAQERDWTAREQRQRLSGRGARGRGSNSGETAARGSGAMLAGALRAADPAQLEIVTGVSPASMTKLRPRRLNQLRIMSHFQGGRFGGGAKDAGMSKMTRSRRRSRTRRPLGPRVRPRTLQPILRSGYRAVRYGRTKQRCAPFGGSDLEIGGVRGLSYSLVKEAEELLAPDPEQS